MENRGRNATSASASIAKTGCGRVLWKIRFTPIQIAERVFETSREERELSEGLPVSECMTLDMMEYLQDRLLAGDESYLDQRSPNTVNSMVASVMAFVRFCKRHGWISEVPPLEKLPVDDVMKGRPISGEEFERMLAATSAVVGNEAADSWKFALRILWESGFRIGDLMDFHWEDDRHIYPVWPTRRGGHATIVIPSSQKNGKTEEIPMLPGLRELLDCVPRSEQTGWVVNVVQVDRQPDATGFRPTDEDIQGIQPSLQQSLDWGGVRRVGRHCPNLAV